VAHRDRVVPPEDALTTVALYGVGHWHARMHLDAFARAGAEIIALGDDEGDACNGFAPELDRPRYRSLDAMLATARPDFVMLMGTPMQMIARAEQAVDAGVPFGTEKPLGRRAEDGAALVRRVAEAGLFATVPLVNRCSRLWRRLADSGRSAVHAHFRIVNGHPERYRQGGVGWVLDPEVHGGGALRNLGIHAADAFLQLCGGEEYRVIAAGIHGAAHGEAVESFGTALLQSASGVLATIEAGYTFPTHAAGGDFEWRVVTDRQYLVDRNDTLSVATFDRSAPVVEPNVPQDGRYGAFASDVLARLRTGRPPLVSLQDGCRAMRLIDRVYQSAAGAEW
jgi:predicted dehydrogenase